MAALDMDYCMIIMDKIINPDTPPDQLMNLVTHLMSLVTHPGMKKIATKIINPKLSEEQKMLLKEEFRNFDHGGANDLSQVDYEKLIDKFVDPNCPDTEYKPTMMALLHGDLEQERRNVVTSIVECQDPEKKAGLVQKFKNFFVKEREEKAALERERAEQAEERRKKKAEEERKAAELEENILEFTDDGMTLIYRMINKKVPPDQRTKIYDRLMEPDVDAEVKNLAIHLINITKFSLMQAAVDDYIKEREDKKVEDERRKTEYEKRRVAAAEDRKNWQENRHAELMSKRNLDERVHKRDLMLKMRAQQRKREAGGEKMNEDEKAAMRRSELQKMREDMQMYKERKRQEIVQKEFDDKLWGGWMVQTFDESYCIEADVVVTDIKLSLAEGELQRALEGLKQKMEAAERELKEAEALKEEKMRLVAKRNAEARARMDNPDPDRDAKMKLVQQRNADALARRDGGGDTDREAKMKLVAQRNAEALARRDGGGETDREAKMRLVAQRNAEALARRDGGPVSQGPGPMRDSAPAPPRPAPAPAAPPPPKVEEKDPDFDKFYEGLSKPELTDKEEMATLTGLIKEKRSGLVKQLVIGLAVDGKGKSAIFKALSKKFGEEISKKREEKGSSKGKNENGVKPEVKGEKKKEDGGDRKRNRSGESNDGKEMKKSKADPSLLIGAFVTKPSDEKEGEKKKHRDRDRDNDDPIKHKKHKKDKDREHDKSRDKEKDREREKKKDKNKEKDRNDRQGQEHKHKKHKKEKSDKHERDGSRSSREESGKSSRKPSTDQDQIKDSSGIRFSLDEDDSMEVAREDKDDVGDELKPPKPYLEMSPTELRDFLKLKRVDCYIKTKNNREVYRRFVIREEQRDREASKEISNGSHSPEPKKLKPGPASSKKKRPGPASMTKQNGSRSTSPTESTTFSTVSGSVSKPPTPSVSPVVFSRSPSRSTSRSPVRFVSRTPSPSSRTSSP